MSDDILNIRILFWHIHYKKTKKWEFGFNDFLWRRYRWSSILKPISIWW